MSLVLFITFIDLKPQWDPELFECLPKSIQISHLKDVAGNFAKYISIKCNIYNDPVSWENSH